MPRVTPGSWQQIEIQGKLADVYEPRHWPEPRGVVIFLHGHGLTTLRENPAYTQQFEQQGLAVVCPHGQRSWWGERICAEFDAELSPARYLLDQVVPFIGETWNVQPPLIAIAGISMGGQGALRLAYHHPREFPVVAAISPAIDFHNWYGQGLPIDDMYDSREQARQDTATLHIHPLNWPRHQWIVCDPTDAEWIESSERLLSKLSSTGIPVESDLQTSHGGHSWEYFDFMAERVVRFVRESLEQEARRLPVTTPD